jgi:hypothetical protein
MKIDMIVLGRAAPELYKQKQSVTVIGYSMKHGYIRLYPTRIDSPLKQWSICSFDALRNPKDMRRESFRLKGNWEAQNDAIQVQGELPRADRIALARKLANRGIESLKNGTVAVIKPLNLTASIEHAGGRKIQKTLGGFDIINKADYEARLMLEYYCSPSCEKKHKHWVIEWGVYEALRKSNDPEMMLKDLHIGDKEYEKYLVIGTKSNKKFVVVSVLRFREIEGKPSA